MNKKLPPTPLGVYGSIMDALAPMMGAGGAAIGSMAGPMGSALGGMAGQATQTIAQGPVNAARGATAGAGNGPAMMALLARSMQSKSPTPKTATPDPTKVTEPTHGMSPGHFNSYADQVKQEQAAIEAGAPAPTYEPRPAPRTTPITTTPASTASPAAIALQRRRQATPFYAE